MLLSQVLAEFILGFVHFQPFFLFETKRNSPKDQSSLDRPNSNKEQHYAPIWLNQSPLRKDFKKSYLSSSINASQGTFNNSKFEANEYMHPGAQKSKTMIDGRIKQYVDSVLKLYNGVPLNQDTLINILNHFSLFEETPNTPSPLSSQSTPASRTPKKTRFLDLDEGEVASI